MTDSPSIYLCPTAWKLYDQVVRLLNDEKLEPDCDFVVQARDLLNEHRKICGVCTKPPEIGNGKKN